MINGNELHIARLSAWAPGVEGPEEWDEWARGQRSIAPDMKGPELSFTEPVFRRRLSQISKMTVQVIHDLLPFDADAKLFFLSFRGELARQFQINKMLIEEKELMPAAFSLSVFNAPVALATIALGLKGGYAALYPAGKNAFAAGLAAAEAALVCGAAREIVFAYADEEPPPEYGCFSNECVPAAFAFLLSRETRDGDILLPPAEEDGPLDYLKRILLTGKIHVSA
ncbi:MAG: beta-ketoacyl synthase chain length factor [Treponema sp.]|jgi:hypothetical protein|nr:beta-ketoacyl synthase chain length factor [Treponema sp.]